MHIDAAMRWELEYVVSKNLSVGHDQQEIYCKVRNVLNPKAARLSDFYPEAFSESFHRAWNGLAPSFSWFIWWCNDRSQLVLGISNSSEMPRCKIWSTSENDFQAIRPVAVAA